MASRQLDEEAIFHIARQLTAAEARAMYLDQICAGDASLRERVESLLKVHEQENEFLHSDSPNPPPTAEAPPPTERPGTTIGRYRLMEQIGEGGMGVVFVAEQEKPIRRKVALKVIKPGMDSKTVIARFESERQALAIMDHVNIAKVLDAGTTDAGRPYFVMELVHGISITDYCDRNKLTIRDRLELFIQVCQAIQHAHQKGIIHRDIKPTNVLVTLHDGKPVPKVIDFGVAKALHQRLTERTVYTSFAQVVGTPLYMSPEQAELSGLDIDTRSDVYSLGVLLYELLTGTTPFDRQQFEKAAYDEIRRIIRETNPPKPSTKIGSLGETATSVSLQRGTDQRTLSKLVIGDLDIIAMKALEKDRTRRYDTAVGLAADVERFLKDEPIIARSPSLAYRFTKSARRNRVAVVTSVLVLTTLVCGIVATTWLASSLKHEVERTTQTLRRLEEAYYEEAVSGALAGDEEKAERAAVFWKEVGASPSQVSVLEGLIALSNGQYDEAIRFARKALDDEPMNEVSCDIGAHSLLAAASVWGGYCDLWEQEGQKLRQLTPNTDTDRLLMAYALVLSDPDEALHILEDRPRIQRSPVGLLIRGQARLLIGVDRQDAKSIGAALQDFQYVQFLCHNNRGSIAWRIHALTQAIELAKRERRDDDVARYAAEARPLAEGLSLIGDYPFGDWSRWLFYRAIGSLEEATQAIRRVGEHPGDHCLFLAANCLLRPGATAAAEEFDKAIVHSDTENRYVQLARAHVVRELPGGAELARGLIKDLLDDPSPIICRHALLVLCLVGNSDEIRERALKAHRTIRGEFYVPGDLFNGNACVKYLAGVMDEQEFLKGTGNHGYSKGVAHFNIAMMRLADGKRTEAREHFTLCVATNTVGSFDYELGRAYLARMEADPTWPSWIRDNVSK